MNDSTFPNKEVRFDIYCPKCVHKDETEDNTDCAECLEHPSNLNSHRPVNFKEKK